MISRQLRRLRKVVNIAFFGTLIERRALFERVASAREHKSALDALGPIDMVIDVGANRGQFSLCAASIFPSAILLSFEPLGAPFGKLKTILGFIEKQGNVVKGFQCALGNLSGRSQINVSKKDDSSSLLKIGLAQAEIFSGTEVSHAEDINIARLDDILSSYEVPDHSIMKIDVQGFELEVLMGAETSLAKIKHVYVECSFIELYEGQALASEVIDFLQRRGFRLSGVYNVFWDYEHGKCVQADFLFCRM